MASRFELAGALAVTPLEGDGPDIGEVISELVALEEFKLATYTLGDDAAVDVDFGGLASANVVVIKVTGGKVRVRLTSADGATQAVPVDSLFVLVDRATSVSAIDLTRTPSTSTRVQVFLGES